MAFPFLTFFIAFIIALALRYAWLDKKRKAVEDEFWEREEQAKHVPKKDLSELDYIKVPLEEFPIGKYQEDEVVSLEDAITALSKKRLINITGMTNTEVKLAYGTDNLEVLSGMEEDYNELTVLLVDYAKALMEHEDFEAAKKVLSFGVETGTDVSTNYELLGDCCLALDQKKEIEDLKQKVLERHLLLESKILFYLDDLLGQNETK
ncbi:MAG: hypothetical protein K6B14_04025 [Lachnospiraceae bacterium]|nr:hypothetical protein [Lachnospiraceae bacterium]